MVVLLDDLHLADASSWEGCSDTWLATSPTLRCSSSPVLGLTRSRNALWDGMCSSGWSRRGCCHRLLLRPLSAPDLRELAERVLVRPSVPPALVTWLSPSPRGTPVRGHLLEALLEEGADLAAPSLAEIPRALAERIAASVEDLDAQSRKALELLAVIGRPVTVAEAAPVSGTGRERLG